MCPAGFGVWHQPRVVGRGGGVAVIARESLSVARAAAPQVRGSELLVLRFGPKSRLGILLLYLPPCRVADSLSDLLEAVAALVLELPGLMVLGDFNLPSLGPAAEAGREFIASMAAMGLTQVIGVPTRASGHSPDLVFLSEQWSSDLKLQQIQTSPLPWSDHYLVTLDFQGVAPYRRVAGPSRLARPRQLMESDRFQMELGPCPPDRLRDSSEVLTSLWEKEVISALDIIAPLRPLPTRRSRGAPWFTIELAELKRVRRRLERRWVKTRSECDRTQVRAAIRAYLVAMRTAKRHFFSALIASADNRPAALFRVTRSLLGKGGPGPGWQGSADDFADHLAEKVARIRTGFDPSMEISRLEGASARSGHVIWEQFDPVDPEDVDKLLGTVRDTTCQLDPCPTWLVKTARATTGSWVYAIINASLRDGLFPSAFKHALVRPLLKKQSLDPAVPSNFRPVSNLPSLGKVLEKVVARQLQGVLDDTDYLDPFQSGFRPGHGTETALVALLDDLWRERDRGHPSVLALLDLSAAFDTVDHGILLGRLQELGARGTVLSWFSSFLGGRTQSVYLENEVSSPRPILCGVPQGAVLSSLLFNIYMKPLGEVIRSHGVRYHQYADDTQLYISAPGDPSEAVGALTRCLEAVRIWMGVNGLQLNPGKTEWLWVRGPGFPRELPSLVLDGAVLPQTDPVRNLGVLLDSRLLLDEQVAAVARGAFAQLRLIRQLRPLLDRDSLLLVTQALVTSRLDYCNALYMGLPLSTIRRLQLVQNAAARVVLGCGRYAPAAPLLRALHWLPVCLRVQYKVLVLTFKALYGSGPGYLRDRLSLRLSARPTRADRRGSLVVPSVKEAHLVGARKRAFSLSAPALWNRLPLELRSLTELLPFRKLLKTWLCHQAWDQPGLSSSYCRWLI